MRYKLLFVLLATSSFHSLQSIAFLKEKLGYSLQVCHEAARQRNEFERQQYKTALECLVSHPNQLVFVDETHKDQQASRRRKAWGIRNSGGVTLRRWFASKVRYTMIASMDVDGFIDSTVGCVLRKDND